MKKLKNPNKYYTNGMLIADTHHRAAKEVAVATGLYRTLGNFGPFHKNRNELAKGQKPVCVVRSGDWEFFLYEYQCMSFSLDTFSTSPLRTELWGLYRPIRKSIKK